MVAQSVKKKIAILGAMGHVAKGLIACWAKDYNCQLFLYARRHERVSEFLAKFEPSSIQSYEMDGFGKTAYDVIVNCVGIGSPKKLQNNPENIFRVSMDFDDLILNYLVAHPHTLYVNLSSGAVYGDSFRIPVNQQSCAKFNINNLAIEEFYGIAKIHSEARHRALAQYNIVDLRIFGYFSRFIDLDENFLLSEIISCIRNKKIFVTNSVNVWRDFLHPRDLASLIELCLDKRPINNAYDTYSRKKVSKYEILDFFSNVYGLTYDIDESFIPHSITGDKYNYYSSNYKARNLGYEPIYSSIDCIENETAKILSR